VPFLVSISKRLCLLMAKYLSDRSIVAVKQAFDSMVSAYTSRHFRITTVLCDGEGAFSSLVTYIQSNGIAVNSTTRNEHVPDIELAGRTLKERV
jgi:hypothetical protein